MDVLTTIAFLLGGVQEINPLVRWAVATLGGPLPGLVAIKVAAMGLGVYCWSSGRYRLLSRVNLFYAGLVAWNMFCLILGLSLR